MANKPSYIQDGLDDEEAGIKFWTELAERSDPEFRKAAEDAAKDEKKHYALLKKIKFEDDDEDEECKPHTLEEARYEEPTGSWTFKCKFCEYFNEKNSSCTKFQTKVKYYGCCIEFHHED